MIGIPEIINAHLMVLLRVDRQIYAHNYVCGMFDIEQIVFTLRFPFHLTMEQHS